MGIAFYRIIKLREENIDIKLPVTLYIIQLILNFLWSIIFFRFNSIKCAFIEIIILFIFIILTILEFRKYDRKAALLMIPYAIWVAFAIYLNYSILMLNM
ncbi:hypothetical protein GCM10008906_18060 [Clostridium oceanicum]|uniref:TspO/MBR family protein n=2 Tax=Clostridium oceanicum TaxID=1543 RepID=A0ABN1JGN9_9CLOT